MKKHLFQSHWVILVVLLLSAGIAQAQTPLRSVSAASIQYTLVQDGGTNGAAVAWDANNKVYFCVIAGNEGFPMEAFDEEGNNTMQGTALFDWRGMWWNPKTKSVEGNGYSEAGWVSLVTEDQTQPVGIKGLFEGMNQPNEQAVGTYEYKKKQVVFFDSESGVLDLYSRKKPYKVTEVVLDASSNLSDFNYTSVGFTGVAGYEFVLLDIMQGKLVYFNRSGNQTGTTKLPDGAPLNDSFAFSFANNHAFLYDKENRVWYGYKVF